ncbi:hypothetical protein ABZX92_42795 [Lentzea sp. NPDC006480]|uniref:hypothetical protein n=1 Tax=Lentzea sp. NPDC006480 TaxID=3157176 RepID=UPI0033B56050
MSRKVIEHTGVPGARSVPAAELGPVVVAVNPTVWGLRAFEWAARRARDIGTELQVFEVDGLPDLPGHPVVGEVMALLPGLIVHFRQTGESLTSDLLTAAASARCIVLGAGAMERAAHVLPVVAGAGCDAVIVRGLPSAVRGEHGVVAAAVGGPADQRVIDRAAMECRRRGARLEVLHAQSAFCGDHMLDDLNAPGVEMVFACHRGLPHELLALTEADLLVVGRGRPGHVGSATKAAIYHSRGPVLIVT